MRVRSPVIVDLLRYGSIIGESEGQRQEARQVLSSSSGPLGGSVRVLGRLVTLDVLALLRSNEDEFDALVEGVQAAEACGSFGDEDDPFGWGGDLSEVV